MLLYLIYKASEVPTTFSQPYLFREKLLFTLMHIISEVMSKIYQTDQFDSHWVSNDKLLGKMFQVNLRNLSLFQRLEAFSYIVSSNWIAYLSSY